MKITQFAMLILLFLLIFAIGATQERERLAWWFRGLSFGKQVIVVALLALFFTASLYFLIHK